MALSGPPNWYFCSGSHWYWRVSDVFGYREPPVNKLIIFASQAKILPPKDLPNSSSWALRQKFTFYAAHNTFRPYHRATQKFTHRGPTALIAVTLWYILPRTQIECIYLLTHSIPSCSHGHHHTLTLTHKHAKYSLNYVYFSPHARNLTQTHAISQSSQEQIVSITADLLALVLMLALAAMQTHFTTKHFLKF